MVIPRTFAGHTARVDDPQVRLNEEFMVVEPQGVETKRMLWAPRGIIAMSWPEQHLSFVKRTRSNPCGQYPQGCNLAIFVGTDNFMVEMESYGEEQPVMPGGRISNLETWQLLDEVFDWQDPDRLISAAG
jgi:hypothetical protein